MVCMEDGKDLAEGPHLVQPESTDCDVAEVQVIHWHNHLASHCNSLGGSKAQALKQHLLHAVNTLLGIFKVRNLQEVLYTAKYMRAGAHHFAKHAENVDEAAITHG
jgi:hypothetical protein